MNNITRLFRILPNGRKQYCSVKIDNHYLYYAMEEGAPWQISYGWTYDSLIKHFIYNGFTLMNKEIKTEVDWLNAIQDNFKEGV